MPEKILFVDDEQNILDAVTRQLMDQFEITTAISGPRGIEIIQNHEPFAVVVADMRMPEMDGIKFLIKVKEISPNATRMMMTGNADLQTAINAVNEGHIFRFLTKPCPPDILIKSLNAGAAQYRLVTAEQDMLEKTLVGSIGMLTELLSLLSPIAYSKGIRLRRIVRHIVAEMKLEGGWQFELAAGLCLVGCFTLPVEIMEKSAARKPMSSIEEETYLKYPLIGRVLIEKIPRLEPIARMVGDQLKPLHELGLPADADFHQPANRILLGSHLLKVALDFDSMVMNGATFASIILAMRRRETEYRPDVTVALATLEKNVEQDGEHAYKIDELKIGMVIAEDIQDERGRLIISRGQEITYTLLMQLYNHLQRPGFGKRMIRVLEN